MEHEELVKKMQGRVDQCRRLANWSTDPHVAEVLNQMADEGEADIKRLLAEEN